MRPSARDTSAAWRRRLTLSTRHVGRLRPHRIAAAGVRPHSARACYIAPAPMNRNPLNWRRVAASSAWVLVAVVALAAPRVLDTFWTSLLIQILVFGLFALSADLLIGHVGLLPMGHAAFFAVGAYATAILEVRHGQGFVLSVLGGLVAATLLAVVFGLAVRTGDVYFILLTLALGNVVWGAAMRWTSFTGGENGVSNVPAPVIAGFRFQRLDDYYYLVLATIVACALGYRKLISSPFGLTLRGIRESESRMRALGYRVGAHKLAAFVLSGALAGLAGVLYIYWNRFVSPAAAGFLVSAEAVLMVILGGSGTVLGPFLGAAVIILIRSYGSAYFVAWWMTAMGLVFIATVLWAPHGLLGVTERFRRGRRLEMASQLASEETRP
ncbi:MAG: branched-chain amino acid ABC transporter permease [Candidatus Rokuibacteriota bacterium]|nr:MAG: branched-chain amino acid ABC transporter permease [Candidatus Rokubacteria bacterium]